MFGWYLGNIQRYPKNIGIGLSKMDKAGGYEKVHEPVQQKFPDTIFI
jgi:hypothetical protein